MSMFACYFRRVKFCNEVGMLGKIVEVEGNKLTVDSGKWKVVLSFIKYKISLILNI